jgi:hypothetical protein
MSQEAETARGRKSGAGGERADKRTD